MPAAPTPPRVAPRRFILLASFLALTAFACPGVAQVSPCPSQGPILEVSETRLGDRVVIEVRGDPGRMGLLGIGTDLNFTPGFCLALGQSLFVQQFQLNQNGSYRIELVLPANDPSLSFRPFALQAAVEDPLRSSGFALTNGVRRDLIPPRLFLHGATDDDRDPARLSCFDLLTRSFVWDIEVARSGATEVDHLDGSGRTAVLRLLDDELTVYDDRTGGVQATRTLPGTTPPALLRQPIVRALEQTQEIIVFYSGYPPSALGGEPTVFQIYDADTLQLVRSINLGLGAPNVAFSNGNRFAYVDDRATMRVIDLVTTSISADLGRASNAGPLDEIVDRSDGTSVAVWGGLFGGPAIATPGAMRLFDTSQAIPLGPITAASRPGRLVAEGTGRGTTGSTVLIASIASSIQVPFVTQVEMDPFSFTPTGVTVSEDWYATDYDPATDRWFTVDSTRRTISERLPATLGAVATVPLMGGLEIQRSATVRSDSLAETWIIDSQRGLHFYSRQPFSPPQAVASIPFPASAFGNPVFTIFQN